MRVADYIWKQLADWGVQHVFLVTGGGAMHLNDALGRHAQDSLCSHFSPTRFSDSASALLDI